MNPLNILVLHNLGDPEFASNFLHHHVYSLQANCPEHNYLYHDATLPLPDYVRDTVFDAIILDVTFLWARWTHPEVFAHTKASYAFVKQSDAVKIAFPQDEYDCNELLDDWFCDWDIDYVFSVLSSDWNVLYPEFSKTGHIKLGYTGYIEQTLIDTARRPFTSRPIDIGYRAKKLPPYFGRIGEIKWTIGRDVSHLSKKLNLHNDIVVGQSGTLFGSAWLDFINASKFTLGSNSGSSLLDPRGNIQKQVKAYLLAHPGAPFDEVEDHCFKGLDGLHSFTAISPRILEAALLESCQILVDGSYSGLIQPWEHYIPIRPDASNFPQVFEAMQDQGLVRQLIRNCRTAILDCDDLRYSHNARKTIDLISDALTRKRVTSNNAKVCTTINRYQLEMPDKYRTHWKKIAHRRKLTKLIDSQPMISKVVRSTHKLLRNIRGS